MKRSTSSRQNRHHKLAEVWRRSGKRCWVCKQGVPLGDATREHKLPAMLGGTATWGNLAIAHRECNQSRTLELQVYTQVWARCAHCREDFSRLAVLRCYGAPVLVTLPVMRRAVQSAAAAAELRAAHDCAKRRRKVRDLKLAAKRPLIGMVES